MKVTELMESFAKPIVESHGCSLWDVEYVREGSERFLRLYIDKEGGVDITDCEAISRAVDPVLDEKDPIPESYHFEVCSAGLERALKRPSDFERFMGSAITVKLYRPRNGLKEIPADGAFDPNYHEALCAVDGEEDDMIAEVFQKGYTLNDKVLRFSKVKVTRKTS